MNSDIRIACTLKTDRKRLRLNLLLGVDESVGFLIDLWVTTAQSRPEGHLDGWDATDIALAAGWRGDPKKFIDALLEAKLIEQNGVGVYQLHDWAEHQPWVSGTTERREAARKAGLSSAIARANKKIRLNNKAKSNVKATEVNGSLKTVVNPLANGMATDGQPRTNTIPIPYQEILGLYHQACPSLPKVATLTEKRRDAIRIRYTQFPEIDKFLLFFNKVESSDFLTGRIKTKDHPNWQCNLDWLLKSDNMVKVLEGHYDNKQTIGSREWNPRG